MTEPALFDAAPYTVVPAVDEKLSPDRRRTMRQASQLAIGLHPVSLQPLHPDAAPHDDRAAEGLRCKGCVFRALLTHHDRTYPKCTHPVELRDGEPIHPAEYQRMTAFAHSAASDCRGWWPACRYYKPSAPVELAGQTDILEGGSP